jgi:hypothetical protein
LALEGKYGFGYPFVDNTYYIAHPIAKYVIHHKESGEQDLVSFLSEPLVKMLNDGEIEVVEVNLWETEDPFAQKMVDVVRAYGRLREAEISRLQEFGQMIVDVTPVENENNANCLLSESLD